MGDGGEIRLKGVNQVSGRMRGGRARECYGFAGETVLRTMGRNPGGPFLIPHRIEPTLSHVR